MKKRIKIILLLIIVAFVILFDISFPFRYSFKVTSSDIIYKIDRFTGKIWWCRPSSCKLVKQRGLIGDLLYIFTGEKKYAP